MGKTIWQSFVHYLMKKHPDKPLKSLLKNYDKKLYAKFKKDPIKFV